VRQTGWANRRGLISAKVLACLRRLAELRRYLLVQELLSHPLALERLRNQLNARQR